MDTANGEQDIRLLELTATIVAAHVSHNAVSVGNFPTLISTVHGGLVGLGQKVEESAKPEPAVSIRASLRPDFLVCLEDGKKLKMLKRHLATRYDMTPDQYRQKWGLDASYPMVAPNYAETRRTLAKKIGLGTTRTRTGSDQRKAA